MNPTEKSEEMKHVLDILANRTESILNNTCVPPPIGCGKQIVGFSDIGSLQEYRISGLCEVCQNEIFNGEVPGDEQYE